MPSLRRSFSSPSVRSSPYPSSLSSPNQSATRSRPNPRRSSGSATAERRVLADIEWWQVYDGQCDPDIQDNGHERPYELDADVSPGGTLTLSAGGGYLEPPQTHTFALESMQHDYPDALPVGPYSPPGARHGRDLSVESTPEMPLAPLEAVQLGLTSPVPPPLDDLFPFPLTRGGGRPVHPLFGLRSVSAPGVFYQGTPTPDFADMGGDSFSLDQNLFQ